MSLSIKIPRADLARGLRLAQSIAPRSGTMPILSSVLLRANGTGSVKIAATDLNVSLLAELPCDVVGQGSVVVNAADLGRFVSGADADTVSIKADGSLRADVRIGKARYQIAGLADRDFPKVVAGTDAGVEVDAEALHDVLSRVAYAVSLDSTREALQGVMLSVEGEQCRWATSDGHRLVLLERKMVMPKTSKRISISPLGIAAIARMLDGAKVCHVSLDERRFHVTCGGITISAGLFDFVAPSFDSFLKLKHKQSAIVNRDRIIAAIKRVAPLTDERNGITLTSTQTGLMLGTRDKDGEEMTDEIECEVTGEIKVGVNAKYLLEALVNADCETVTLKLLGDLDPIVIANHDDPGFTAVVMPMRM